MIDFHDSFRNTISGQLTESIDLLDSDSEKPRNEVKPTILTLQTNNVFDKNTTEHLNSRLNTIRQTSCSSMSQDNHENRLTIRLFTSNSRDLSSSDIKILATRLKQAQNATPRVLYLSVLLNFVPTREVMSQLNESLGINFLNKWLLTDDSFLVLVILRVIFHIKDIIPSTLKTLIASTLRRQNRGDQFLKVVIPAILPILSLPQTVPPRLSTNHTPAAPPKILPDPTSHRPLKPLSGPASSSTTPPSPPQLPLFLPPLPTEGPLLFEANTPSSMMVSLPPSLPSSIPPPLRSSSSSFPPPLPPFTGNVDEDQSFGLPYNNNRNMGISGSDAAMIGLIDELTRKNTYINIARTHTNPYAVSPSFIPPEVQKAHPAPFVPPTIHIASSRSPNPTSSLSRQHLKKRYTIREKPNVVIRHYLPENNKNPSQLRSSRLISAAVDGIQQDLSNQSSRHSPSPPAYPTIPYALPPSIAVPKHLPHGPIMAGENLPPFQRIMAVYVNSNLGAWYVGGRKPPSSPTEYLGGSVGSDADKHSLPTVSFYSPSVSGRPYASDAEWPSIARGSDIVETIIPSTLSTTSQPALPPPPQPIRLNPTPPSTNPTTPHYSPTPLPQTLPPPIPHSNTFQQSTHTPTTFTQTQFTPPQFKSPTQYTQTQFPQNQFTSTHLPSHPPPHQFASQSAPRPFTPNTPVPTQFTPGHFAIAADSPPLTPFVTPRYLPSAIPQNHEPFNRPPIERLPKPPMPHTSVNSQIPIPPPHRQHLPPPRTDSDPWTNTPTPEYGNRTNPAVPLNPQQSLDFWNGRQGFERQPSRDAFPPQISRDFRDQVDSPSNRNVQDQRTSRDRRHSRDRRDSHNRYDSPARSRRGDRRRRSYNRYSSSPSPPPTTSSGWDCVKADTAISITEDDLVDPNTYYLDSNGNRIPIRQQAQPKKAQQQGWGTSGLPPDDTSRSSHSSTRVRNRRRSYSRSSSRSPSPANSHSSRSGYRSQTHYHPP